jgi:hypothetical protein
MVCNTQNYWVFGLCLSCGIPKTGKHVSETGSLSEGPNRVGVSPSPEDGNI